MGLIREARGLPKLMLNCEFWRAPEFSGIGLDAIGLHVAGISYAYRYATDGALPGEPDRLAVALGVSRPELDHALEQLLEVGRWARDDSGALRIVDYELDHPTRAEMAAQRELKRKRTNKTNHIRWHEQRGTIDPACELCMHPESSNDHSTSANGISGRSHAASREQSSGEQSSTPPKPPRRQRPISAKPEPAAPQPKQITRCATCHLLTIDCQCEREQATDRVARELGAVIANETKETIAR